MHPSIKGCKWCYLSNLLIILCDVYAMCISDISTVKYVGGGKTLVVIYGVIQAGFCQF